MYCIWVCHSVHNSTAEDKQPFKSADGNDKQQDKNGDTGHQGNVTEDVHVSLPLHPFISHFLLLLPTCYLLPITFAHLLICSFQFHLLIALIVQHLSFIAPTVFLSAPPPPFPFLSHPFLFSLICIHIYIHLDIWCQYVHYAFSNEDKSTSTVGGDEKKERGCGHPVLFCPFLISISPPPSLPSSTPPLSLPLLTMSLLYSACTCTANDCAISFIIQLQRTNKLFQQMEMRSNRKKMEILDTKVM